MAIHSHISLSPSSAWSSLAVCLILAVYLGGCTTGKIRKLKTDDDRIELVFLHLSDVSEAFPIPGSELGGLDRVATIKKQLVAENSLTFMFMSGNALYNCAGGTTDGGDVRMVELLNELGLSGATFGVQDLLGNPSQIQDQLDASTFPWFSGNVRTTAGDTLARLRQRLYGRTFDVPARSIIQAVDVDGTMVRIGLLSATGANTEQSNFYVEDPLAMMDTSYRTLEDQVDFFLALTNLPKSYDIELAKRFPRIRLIMGGYGHERTLEEINGCIIARGDPNAKSIYIHRLVYNRKTNKTIVRSDPVELDKSIRRDPKLATLVDLREQKVKSMVEAQGFQMENIVAPLAKPLDGRYAALFNEQTNLGNVVTGAMTLAAPVADCALFNSGAIKLNDVIRFNLYEYDLIRMFPEPYPITAVKMDGELLYEILSTGLRQTNNGSFLQMSGINTEVGINTYYSGKRKITAGEEFVVAMPVELLNGQVRKYGFLSPDHPLIKEVDLPDATNPDDLKHDLRMAIYNLLRE